MPLSMPSTTQCAHNVPFPTLPTGSDFVPATFPAQSPAQCPRPNATTRPHLSPSVPGHNYPHPNIPSAPRTSHRTPCHRARSRISPSTPVHPRPPQTTLASPSPTTVPTLNLPPPSRRLPPPLFPRATRVRLRLRPPPHLHTPFFPARPTKNKSGPSLRTAPMQRCGLRPQAY